MDLDEWEDAPDGGNESPDQAVGRDSDYRYCKILVSGGSTPKYSHFSEKCGGWGTPKYSHIFR